MDLHCPRLPHFNSSHSPRPTISLRLSQSTAPPTVDLTRLDSPSLASFTPSNYEHIQGAAHDCLKAVENGLQTRMRARSLITHMTQSGAKALRPGGHSVSAYTLASTGSNTRPRILSLFSKVADTAAPPSPISSPEDLPITTPSSPTNSVPSISRTHSSATSESLPPTPPPLPTPLDSPPALHLSLQQKLAPSSRRRAPSLPLPSPTRSLAALEAASKLMRTRTACAMCGAIGADFPRCPWCDQAWCSRACRTAARGKGAEGKGHGCMSRRSGVKDPKSAI